MRMAGRGVRREQGRLRRRGDELRGTLGEAHGGPHGQGERLAAIASECSYLADSGITGFMYGAAVSTLARVWIHGEALRLWHNLKTQIGDEGSVRMNPVEC